MSTPDDATLSCRFFYLAARKTCIYRVYDRKLTTTNGSTFLTVSSESAPSPLSIHSIEDIIDPCGLSKVASIERSRTGLFFSSPFFRFKYIPNILGRSASEPFGLAERAINCCQSIDMHWAVFLLFTAVLLGSDGIKRDQCTVEVSKKDQYFYRFTRAITDGSTIEAYEGRLLHSTDPRDSHGLRDSPLDFYDAPLLPSTEEEPKKNRPITMSSVQSLELRNNDRNEELIIQGVSVDSSNFRVSLSKHTIGAMSMGNITVTHLPREMSCSDSKMTVNTNRGHFFITIHGCGIFSPYRIPPVIKAKLMPDWVYNQPISVYNPFAKPLEILEVYISGGLMLTLPEEGEGSIDDGTKRPVWTVPPYESRHIVTAVFQSATVGEHVGLVYIRTNAHKLVVPVEVTVVKDVLQSVPAELDFSVITSFDQTVSGSFSVLNSGRNYVKLTKMVHMGGVHDYVTPSCQFSFTPGKVITPAVQSYALGITCSCRNHTLLENFPSDPVVVRGKVALYTNESSTPIDLSYKLRVLIGNIEYVKNSTYFAAKHRDSRPSHSHAVTLSNDFPSPIVVYAAEVVDHRFVISSRNLPMVVPPKTSWSGLNITFTPDGPQEFDSHVTLITNLSLVTVPLHVIHGKLNALNASRINLGVVAIHQEHHVYLTIRNDNTYTVPIQCVIRKSDSQSVRLDMYEGPEGGNQSYRGSIHTTRECSDHRSPLLIEVLPGHTVSFSLRIPNTRQGTFVETLQVVTPYERIPFRLTYRVAHGNFKFMDSPPGDGKPTVRFESPVSSGGSVISFLHAINSFNFPLAISGFTSSNPSFYLQLMPQPLQTNQTQHFANLIVDLQKNSTIAEISSSFVHPTSRLTLSPRERRLGEFIRNLHGTFMGSEFSLQSNITTHIHFRAEAQIRYHPIIVNTTQEFIKGGHLTPIVVNNPSNHPMKVQLLKLVCDIDQPAFTIHSDRRCDKTVDHSVHTVPSHHNATLGWIRFKEIAQGPHSCHLHVRNNITMFDEINLITQQPHGTLVSIAPDVEIQQSRLNSNPNMVPLPSGIDFYVEFQAEDFKPCRRPSWPPYLQFLLGRNSVQRRNERIIKSLTLYNTGNSVIQVDHVTIDGREWCVVDGNLSEINFISDTRGDIVFAHCAPFTVQPLSTTDILLHFSTKLDELKSMHDVTLRHSGNTHTHKLMLSIPQDQLSTCKGAASTVSFEFMIQLALGVTFSIIITLLLLWSTREYRNFSENYLMAPLQSSVHVEPVENSETPPQIVVPDAPSTTSHTSGGTSKGRRRDSGKSLHVEQPDKRRTKTPEPQREAARPSEAKNSDAKNSDATAKRSKSPEIQRVQQMEKSVKRSKSPEARRAKSPEPQRAKSAPTKSKEDGKLAEISPNSDVPQRSEVLPRPVEISSKLLDKEKKEEKVEAEEQRKNASMVDKPSIEEKKSTVAVEEKKSTVAVEEKEPIAAVEEKKPTAAVEEKKPTATVEEKRVTTPAFAVEKKNVPSTTQEEKKNDNKNKKVEPPKAKPQAKPIEEVRPQVKPIEEVKPSENDEVKKGKKGRSSTGSETSTPASTPTQHNLPVLQNVTSPTAPASQPPAPQPKRFPREIKKTHSGKLPKPVMPPQQAPRSNSQPSLLPQPHTSNQEKPTRRAAPVNLQPAAPAPPPASAPETITPVKQRPPRSDDVITPTLSTIYNEPQLLPDDITFLPTKSRHLGAIGDRLLPSSLNSPGGIKGMDTANDSLCSSPRKGGSALGAIGSGLIGSGRLEPFMTTPGSFFDDLPPSDELTALEDEQVSEPSWLYSFPNRFVPSFYGESDSLFSSFPLASSPPAMRTEDSYFSSSLLLGEGEEELLARDI
ncbi:neurofilament heavy polypeptide [Planoprotostelium fungivorum]|uniref:Neurofilament heavy polypeptide n=1 Tax=Planoprotostelium fungivorum TaxID=1890364 RepID=A0A2P6MTT5_9EUKA|nr:neurofilament heavy polypeptide [Planoprotostelium fungivorum]